MFKTVGMSLKIIKKHCYTKNSFVKEIKKDIIKLQVKFVNTCKQVNESLQFVCMPPSFIPINGNFQTTT